MGDTRGYYLDYYNLVYTRSSKAPGQIVTIIRINCPRIGGGTANPIQAVLITVVFSLVMTFFRFSTQVCHKRRFFTVYLPDLEAITGYSETVVP